MTVTLLTTAPVARTAKVALAAGLFGFSPVFSSVGLFWFSRKRRPRAQIAGVSIALLLIMLCLSCGGGVQGDGGGGENPGTPPGSYNVKLTAVSGAVAHNTSVSLTVTP